MVNHEILGCLSGGREDGYEAYEDTPKGKLFCRLVIKDGAEIAAYLNGSFTEYKVFDCALGEYVAVERNGYIADVSVEENHRGQGLGPSLIGQFEEIAEWLGCVAVTGVICTYDLNNWPYLPEFYRKLGYEVIDIPTRREKDLLKKLSPLGCAEEA